MIRKSRISGIHRLHLLNIRTSHILSRSTLPAASVVWYIMYQRMRKPISWWMVVVEMELEFPNPETEQYGMCQRSGSWFVGGWKLTGYLEGIDSQVDRARERYMTQVSHGSHLWSRLHRFNICLMHESGGHHTTKWTKLREGGREEGKGGKNDDDRLHWRYASHSRSPRFVPLLSTLLYLSAYFALCTDQTRLSEHTENPYICTCGCGS